jgi:hypothetical protein
VVSNDLFDNFSRLLAADLAARITKKIAPLVGQAVAYLQDLKVYCPEAFDEAGTLRPEWQTIVRARLEAENRIKAVPEFHFELMSRKFRVNVN